MTITSFVFNAEQTGEQRRVTVGHVFDGYRVLAIDGSAGGVSVVREGGTVLTIPSGSVVQVIESGMGALAPRAPAQKAKPLVQTDPNGPVTGIVFHDGLGVRTLRVGNTVTDSAGRPRQVAKFVMGDPWSVIGLDGALLLEIGAGSVSRWA